MGEGRNTVTAFGLQANQSTQAPTFSTLYTLSNELEGSGVEVKKSEVLDGNPFASDQYIVAFTPGGSVKAEFSLTPFGTILKALFGQEPTTPGVGSKQYDPGLNLTHWLTFLKYLKDEGVYEYFIGSRINQMTFELVSKSVVTYSIDVLSTMATLPVEGTPTFTKDTGQKLFAWQTTALLKTVDVTGDLNEFKFTHNNNINADKYGMSRNRKKLNAQDRTHEFTLNMDFVKDQYLGLKSDLINGVVIPLSIDIGGKIQIDYPKAKLKQINDPISGPGEITIPLSGEAFWDNTAGSNVSVTIADE